jgi:octaheme c-type cytochrome (tetrathionate reductase family)
MKEIILSLMIFGWLIPSYATTINSTADHSKFKELDKIFTNGPQVTAACLVCHTESATQIHQTTHWNWQYINPKTEQKLGKKNIFNNFCISPTSNYTFCASCHIGYGFKDESFDFTSQNNVDCLSCHDTTRTYKKLPGFSGHPLYEPLTKAGKIIQPPDLTKIAKNVGKTSRATCGSCHFYGGGGDAVKHGDLDSSLNDPNRALDVHMDKKGLDFNCAECHTADNHSVSGSRYNPTAIDDNKAIIKGEKTNRNKTTCQACHSNSPHKVSRLNNHSKKIACQTCHIPTYARGGVQTKMTWDWSTAGKLDKKGKPITIKDSGGRNAYTSKKGDFTWDSYVIPEYRWFNGKVKFIEKKEKIDPTKTVFVNKFYGSHNDGKSKIWPLKIFRGKQPYDKKYLHLLIPHTAGKDDSAFWSHYDWDKALTFGAAVSTVKYSGEHDFVKTQMSWPITHMVAPKDDALSCTQCHRENSRLKNIKGIYMPAANNIKYIDSLMSIILMLMISGVTVHGLIRLFLFYLRRRI